MRTFCVITVLASIVAAAFAAQPTFETFPPHVNNRIGLELETKEIAESLTEKTAESIFLIAIDKNNALSSKTLALHKHAWLVPQDGRNAGAGVYSADAVGALTGEVDSMKNDAQKCGRLEFVFRPSFPIANKGSVTEMMAIARAWDLAMVEPCMGRTGTGGLDMLVTCDTSMQANDGSITPQAKGKGNWIVPAETVADLFNSKLDALGQGYAKYKVKVTYESVKFHEITKEKLYLVCPVRRSLEFEDEARNKQLALLKKGGTGGGNRQFPSLDIAIHVNMYTLVDSLTDGSFDALIPNGQDHARSSLAFCRDVCVKAANAMRAPSYAPALILLCWMASIDDKNGKAHGGANKDLFSTMPKISVAALARSVKDENQSAAFYTWATTTGANLKTIAGALFDESKLNNLGVTKEAFTAEFAKKGATAWVPSSEENTAKAFGYGKVASQSGGSGSAPYDDYGIVTFNDLPAFVAEVRQPERHQDFGVVLPSKFAAEVQKGSDPSDNLYSIFSKAVGIGKKAQGTTDTDQGGCWCTDACDVAHGWSKEQVANVGSQKCQLCLRTLSKALTAFPVDAAACKQECIKFQNNPPTDFKATCVGNALGSPVLKGLGDKEGRKAVNDALPGNRLNPF